MELLANLALGFETALSPWNLLYCFVGVLLGTAVGVLPGLGPIATIAMLLPLTFSLPPVSALIMLAGIYYGAQYGGSTTAILINLPGESFLGRNRDRRLPDGQAGPGRAGAGDRGPGLVLRRLGRDPHPGAVRAAARQRGAAVRPGRIFLAHGAGPRHLGGAGLGLAAQGIHHDRARAAAGPGRHRRRERHPALHLRPARTSRRAQLRGADHGRVRAGRDHPQPRARADPQRDGQACHRADAVARRLQADHRPSAARHRLGLGAGHPAGRRGDAGLVRRLHHGKAGLAEPGPVRQGCDRGRGGARKRQQCGGPDLVHPDADPGHPVQPGDGADDRRPDHPGHHPRPQCGDRRAGPVLGHDRRRCGSAT